MVLVLNMLFYAMIAGVTSIGIHYSNRIKKENIRYISIGLTLAFSAFFACIRYGVGTDYFYMYKPYFDGVASGHMFRENMEVGFFALNKIICILGGNLEILLFIVALLTVLFVYLGLLEYQKYINVPFGMLVFMLLFYQLSLNAMRQVLAIAIIFYALKYIYKRKLLWFIVWILIASTIHFSALIFIPFYFLYIIFDSKKYKYIQISIYIVLLIIALFYDKILYPIMSQISFLEYYANYFRKSKELTFSIGMIIRTVPLLLPYFLMRDKIKSHKPINFLFSFMIYYSIIRLMAYTSVFFVERIAYYFYIAVIVLVPYYCKYFIKNKKYIYALVLILYVVFMWFYDYGYLGIGETIPYKTIFSY